MRRNAEVAHSSTSGAYHALHAARDAAREACEQAAGLTIAADEAQAIRNAAISHLHAIEHALGHAEEALKHAIALDQAVDRAEISRFGIPVLRPAAGQTGAAGG